MSIGYIPKVSIRARHCWRAIRSSRARTSSCVMFQSAPAIAGGRYVACRRSPAARRSFNPRPPLLAGDTCRRRFQRALSAVSIRARHCWRAILAGGRKVGGRSWFQSAPAIAGGRYELPIYKTGGALLFQSAPAIAGGRYTAWMMGRSTRLRFQSAPAIAGGRYMASSRTPPSSFCFNPRPPLLAGDTLDARRLAANGSVSIRARHCWRAIRFMCTPLVLPGFSLQMRVPAKSAYADAAIHR